MKHIGTVLFNVLEELTNDEDTSVDEFRVVANVAIFDVLPQKMIPLRSTLAIGGTEPLTLAALGPDNTKEMVGLPDATNLVLVFELLACDPKIIPENNNNGDESVMSENTPVPSNVHPAPPTLSSERK